MRETPAAEQKLAAVADSIEQRNREILRALRGDVEIARRNEVVPTSIDDRVNSIMEGERFSLAKPTQTNIDSYNIAAAEFGEQLAKLHTLVDSDLAKLEKDMEAGWGAVDSGTGAGVVGEIILPRFVAIHGCWSSDDAA